jgi:hypothetical protein
MNNPTGRAARRSWRRIGCVLAVVAVLVVAVLGWWLADDSLSDGERQIVGTWRVRWDGSMADLPIEYEFQPDRTCVLRQLDPATGTVIKESAGQTWRRRGDTLVIRSPDGGYAPWWDVTGAGREVREKLTLTADGPGRFRYLGTIEAGRSPAAEPPISGTMTRRAATP